MSKADKLRKLIDWLHTNGIRESEQMQWSFIRLFEACKLNSTMNLSDDDLLIWAIL